MAERNAKQMLSVEMSRVQLCTSVILYSLGAKARGSWSRGMQSRRMHTAWIALMVGIVALAGYIYLHINVATSSRAGRYNYHMYLAEAFLHGSLSLVRQLPNTLDLSLFNGKLFLYWGPMPAVALVPLVFLFGADWSDVWLTMGLATLNTMALFVLLETTRRLHGLSLPKTLLLTAVFGFGSPLVPLALDGTVWYVGQLFTTLFVTSAMIFALRTAPSTRDYLIAALLMGMACLSRASVLGAVVWLLALIFLRARKRSLTPVRSALAVAPAIAVLGFLVMLLSMYNYARFGSPFENGLKYHRADLSLFADINTYGLFSVHYFGKNFFYHYLAYPYPPSSNTFMGASLFLMTPVYLGAFFALKAKHEYWQTIWGLWFAIALIALPSLLLCGTGWSQIGPRYTLDYAPFLLILVAMGIRRWSSQLLLVLAGISVLHYLYGLLLIA